MNDPRIALVTGASGGVGSALVSLLIDAHWEVHAQYRTQPGSAEAQWFAADLSTETYGLEGFPHLERVDAVIHCAGWCRLSSLAEAPMEDWEQCFRLNLAAPAAITQHYLPALRRAGGSLVYLNSGAGQTTRPNWAVYSSIKHAARAWCNGLRQEEPDIRVCSIYPGRIDTPMQQAVVAQEGGIYRPEQYLSPESVAESVLYALNHTTSGAKGSIQEITIRP